MQKQKKNNRQPVVPIITLWRFCRNGFYVISLRTTVYYCVSAWICLKKQSVSVHSKTIIFIAKHTLQHNAPTNSNTECVSSHHRIFHIYCLWITTRVELYFYQTFNNVISLSNTNRSHKMTCEIVNVIMQTNRYDIN